MIEDKEYLSVKDVAEMLDTEAYVLRFYEKELHLDIRRNVKGHRVYSLEDVEMFKKIQDLREKGLQLKAIETIVHDGGSEEAKETYEQLSSIAVLPGATPIPTAQDLAKVDITDTDDEKVKRFSSMMKDVFKQALTEYNVVAEEKIHDAIRQEVELAVDEKVGALTKEQTQKNEEYYKKLDETMREVQKMRREFYEAKPETQKEKISLWKRIFKDKNQTAQM